MEEWWKNKLFQPKNIEGKPVKEELQYVRDLFELASKADPRLKGITIIGSTLKGYAKSVGEKVSDIDVMIVYDDSQGISPKSQQVSATDFIVKFYDAVNNLNDIRKERKLPTFKIVAITRCNINNLTPRQIRELPSLSYLGTEGISRYVAGLVFPGVGDLETYRKIVRDEISKYPKDEKENWLKYLIDYAVKGVDSKKTLERGIIKEDEEKDFLEARRKLINARVRRIFG